jgi:cysteine-rich CWC protein
MSEPASCERCGARFGCGAADGDCWCARVPVSETVRGELARDYRDCLCPTCLRDLASDVRSIRPTH